MMMAKRGNRTPWQTAPVVPMAIRAMSARSAKLRAQQASDFTSSASILQAEHFLPKEWSKSAKLRAAQVLGPVQK